MKAIGVTAKSNEMRGNFRDCGMYSTLMNYLCLDVEEVDDDTYLCVILKDVQFKPVYPSKKAKRAWLRELIKQNHIKEIVQ